MSTTATMAFEVEPVIESNPPLYQAIQKATDLMRDGLKHIDDHSDTATINPAILWSADEHESDKVMFVYREEAPPRSPLRVTMRRIPVSQLLDPVGRRSWVLKLLQSVNSRRYDSVIERFETLIKAQEEAEANGK